MSEQRQAFRKFVHDLPPNGANLLGDETKNHLLEQAGVLASGGEILVFPPLLWGEIPQSYIDPVWDEILRLMDERCAGLDWEYFLWQVKTSLEEACRKHAFSHLSGSYRETVGQWIGKMTSQLPHALTV